MPEFGLLGRSLKHSFSQTYFTQKFHNLELPDYRYELFELATMNELPALLARHPELQGLNVTIPYKEQVWPFLNEVAPSAARGGAVNVMEFRADGQLIGHNTDYITQTRLKNNSSTQVITCRKKKLFPLTFAPKTGYLFRQICAASIMKCVDALRRRTSNPTGVGYFACFLPFSSTNLENLARDTPYQSLPLAGDHKTPLGLTLICPTTFPSASTISWSSNLRGRNELTAISYSLCGHVCRSLRYSCSSELTDRF